MKKVGKAMYVHVSALHQILEKLDTKQASDLMTVLYTAVRLNISFDIIKYEYPKISLIQSPAWDTANEPTVGYSYCFNVQNNLNDYKKIKPSGKIYHSKELFVDSNYTGFSVDDAKKRTKLWNSIPNIDKRRIGNRVYWLDLLSKNNIPI